MGGGDLNLKKSWHPSTLRNIERVWKAEQKHEAEQQKIEQLQKELAAERAREEIQAYAEDKGVIKKRDERLDWMYQGPAALVNREEYLLGRKIDKTFEMLQMQESGKEIDKRQEEQSRSIFHPEVSTSDLTVDLENKIKEDPLFAIMKREKEQRKDLLNNPVRMKQLQAMLKHSVSKKKKKKDKKEKRKKSKKTKHEKESSSDDADSSSEEEKHYRKEKLESRKRKNDYSSERISKSDDYYHQSKHKKSKNGHYEDRHVDKYNYKSQDHRESHKHKERSSEKCERSHRSPKRHNEDYMYGKEKERRQQNSEKKPAQKRVLSSAEKEKLREEMMANAKWRDEQRSKNVKRYERESEKEERKEKGSPSNFIMPMLSKAAECGTVEDRVRQKIFTIQRKKSDMNSNFARR